MGFWGCIWGPPFWGSPGWGPPDWGSQIRGTPGSGVLGVWAFGPYPQPQQLLLLQQLGEFIMHRWDYWCCAWAGWALGPSPSYQPTIRGVPTG